MCSMAGRVADAALSVGVDLTLQTWRKQLVDRGAEEAGRDPAEIDFWIRTEIYLADSKEAARLEVTPYAGAVAWGLVEVLRRKAPETMELAQRIEAAQPGILAEMEAIYDNWDPYWTERIGGP